MTNKKSLIACSVVMLCAATTRFAYSQPNPGTPKPDSSPALSRSAAEAQRRQAESTLQQLRESLRQAREMMTRTGLSGGGIEDAGIQDAVVELAEQQHTRREPLRKSARRLTQAIASEAVTDAALNGMLAAFQAQLQEEGRLRVAALQALDTKIGYSRSPHLELALTMVGLLGDEAAVLDGVPQSLQRMQAHSLPDALERFGLVDKQIQETIVKFVVEYEEALSPLLGQAWKVPFIKYRKGPAVDEKSLTALNELRAAVASHKVRRANALRKLDAKIGYTHSPRLQAALLLLGITGEDASLLDDVNLRGTIGFGRFTNIVTGERVK